MSRFVLSESEFRSIKSAEDKVAEWQRAGTLKTGRVRLYKITEVYDLKLKFVKRQVSKK